MQIFKNYVYELNITNLHIYNEDGEEQTNQNIEKTNRQRQREGYSLSVHSHKVDAFEVSLSVSVVGLLPFSFPLSLPLRSLSPPFVRRL